MPGGGRRAGARRRDGAAVLATQHSGPAGRDRSAHGGGGRPPRRVAAECAALPRPRSAGRLGRTPALSTCTLALVRCRDAVRGGSLAVGVALSCRWCCLRDTCPEALPPPPAPFTAAKRNRQASRGPSHHAIKASPERHRDITFLNSPGRTGIGKGAAHGIGGPFRTGASA